MAFTEDQIISLEIREDGRINVKTINRVWRTNDSGRTDSVTGEVIEPELVSAVPHRSVLDPKDAQYQERLASISTQVVGQLAIQQNAVINDESNRRGKAESDCAAHLARIAELESIIAQMESTLAAING